MRNLHSKMQELHLMSEIRDLEFSFVNLNSEVPPWLLYVYCIISSLQRILYYLLTAKGFSQQQSFIYIRISECSGAPNLGIVEGMHEKKPNYLLMNEAEYLMKNYGDQGGCYLPQPTASMDNTLRDLHVFSLVLTLKSSEMTAIFVFTTKTTQPHPQVFLVNGALTCKKAAYYLMSSVD